MESVAARMAMVTDSPNPSLRSRTTVTTDGDSFVSTTSLPCCHFLSANVINVVSGAMIDCDAAPVRLLFSEKWDQFDLPVSH
ncbi:hypothetical protein JOB18_043112 [Solea senegalensis]|uniref:Uncharacterized protein n=1 Tax=Solea senegalensis TaxID=28829 RepID=A0AAV6SUC6_SOLSE|nr:hypothetical protein JOB18_043112 [Solea senegalensis]